MSERARTLRIFADQCQGMPGGARLIEEAIDASLDRFAAEQRLEEAKVWESAMPVMDVGVAVWISERRAALEKAAKGEK